MTDKLKQAIEVLKWHKDRDDFGSMVYEAIDTVVEALEKPTYTAEDMEAFAEWCSVNKWNYDVVNKEWVQYGIGENNDWFLSHIELRELWEQEMDVNTSEPTNIKQQCPECGDESYNSDGNYCLNSNCKLFII